LKKELLIFTGIFLFLALSMHFKEWLSHPIEHVTSLPTAGAYGVGAFHPLIFTLVIYIFILIFRVIFSFFGRSK